MPNDINEMKKFVNNVKKLVEKKVNNAKTDTSKKAIVQSLNEDGTANIIINGEVYNNVKVRPGLQPQINEVVLVSIPNNNTKDIFIDLASSNSLDADIDEHLADGIHQKVEVTSTDNATSATNAPLKTAGGLAVAKDLYVGGNTYIPTEVGRWLRKFFLYEAPKNRNAILKLTANHPYVAFFIEVNIIGNFNDVDRRGYHKYIVSSGAWSFTYPSWKVIDIAKEGINDGSRMIGSPSFSNNVCSIPITFPTGASFAIWVTGGSHGSYNGLITNIELVEADN